MVKKIGFAISIIFIILGIIFFVTTNKEKQDLTKQIKTASAKKGTLKIAFSIDGKTSIERRDLKFTVSGKVAHIAVKEGQEVKQWQYLMSLDTQDVQKNLQKDLKDYLIARNSFDQADQVTYPSGPLNDTIKRTLENSQYSLDKSVLDVEIGNIALKESYLYSPIEGVVSSINIKEGETTNTQSGNVVITITKPGNVSFEAYAEDIDALKINNNQTTLIKIDAIPNISFPSKIDFISNLATVDQNGLSSYKVRASITNEKGYRLLDGMSGSIEFITKEKSGILTIPNTAVYRKNNQSFVLKLEKGEKVETFIEAGFTDGKEVEIISGLIEGNTVIIQ